MTAADAPASHKARQRLVLRLQELGAPDAEQQRHVCAVWTGGRARRRTELTERDAGTLYARLREMNRDDLAAVLARPAPGIEPDPEPEPVDVVTARAIDAAACLASWDEPAPTPEPVELPAGAIACGGGPTAEDVAAVRAFAGELAERGAAPTPEELAAVQVEETAPCVATWCEDDGCTATHPDPEPEAPARPPVVLEPVPEDVEEAAAAAVARFRERQAAGIIPAAPDLASLPPRIPIELGPPPGRYCLATCYCGGCEHWTPIPPVDYSKTPGSTAYEYIHGKY